MAIPAMGLTKEERSALSREEKRNYILALITMAASDGNIAGEELHLIKLRAKALNSDLKKKDLKSYDISDIPDQIQKTGLRKALFQDLIAMARADLHWDNEGLSILRYFSMRWNQPLQQQTNMKVKWSEVQLPTPVELEEISRRKQGILTSPAGRKIVQSSNRGTHWRWVFISSGFFLGLNLGFFITVGATVLSFDTGYFFFCQAAGFLTGMITARISKHRLLWEPGFGSCITLIILYLALAIPDAIQLETFSPLIGLLAIAADIFQFALPLCILATWGTGLGNHWAGKTSAT